MNHIRNKLYLILSVVLVSGYSWLYYSLTAWQAGNNDNIDLCLFRNISGLPCPSCGSTRAVISLLNGNLQESLYINPIGLIIASVMILTPIWILTDILFSKSSLLNFYSVIEIFFRKPIIAFPLIFLIVINWIWNILKDV
jgi:hypothetical protein